MRLEYFQSLMNEIYFFKDISTPFSFGRYEGVPLCNVVIENPSYVYWCIDNISSFIISSEALKQIRDLFPNFIVTENFNSHIDLF